MDVPFLLVSSRFLLWRDAEGCQGFFLHPLNDHIISVLKYLCTITCIDSTHVRQSLILGMKPMNVLMVYDLITFLNLVFKTQPPDLYLCSWGKLVCSFLCFLKGAGFVEGGVVPFPFYFVGPVWSLKLNFLVSAFQYVELRSKLLGPYVSRSWGRWGQMLDR